MVIQLSRYGLWGGVAGREKDRATRKENERKKERERERVSETDRERERESDRERPLVHVFLLSIAVCASVCLHRSAFKVGWIWMDWNGEESSRLEYARMAWIEIERAEYKLEYDGSEMER